MTSNYPTHKLSLFACYLRSQKIYFLTWFGLGSFVNSLSCSRPTHLLEHWYAQAVSAKRAISLSDCQDGALSIQRRESWRYSWRVIRPVPNLARHGLTWGALGSTSPSFASLRYVILVSIYQTGNTYTEVAEIMFVTSGSKSIFL